MSQCEQILRYMEEFGSITNREAMLNLDIGRLHSRICELRQRGYNIVTETVRKKNGKTFAKYRLEG